MMDIGVDPSCFNKNLEKLKDIHPQLALSLPQNFPSHLSLVATPGGEWNLKDRGDLLFYDGCSPEKESQEWYRLIDLEEVDVLIVHGIGLGHYYEVLKEWLQGSLSRYLVFLEDRLDVLRFFFSTTRAEELIENPQVQIHYLDWDRRESILRRIAGFFLLSSYQIAFLKSYQERNPKRCETLRNLCVYILQKQSIVAQEILKGGNSFFSHFYKNLLKLPESKLGDSLYGAFQNIPAIIVGAGPSLDKHLEVLRTLSDKACLLAAGSAVNILLSQGIRPHFTLHTDPNDLQIKRLQYDSSYEIPHFLSLRLHHSMFSGLVGPRILLQGSAVYPLADWFEEKLQLRNEDSPRIQGDTASNLALCLAILMKCNPIIFVGMDLAHTDGKAYAESFNFEKQTQFNAFDGSYLFVEDIYGNRVSTLWKWVQESQSLGEEAQKSPGRRYINATEGGIGIPNTENMPLMEVVDKHLNIDRDLNSRFHVHVENLPNTEVSLDNLLSYIEQVDGSMLRCEQQCIEIVLEIQNVIKKIRSGSTVPDSLQTANQVLLEIELHEELVYTEFLASIEMVYENYLERRYYEVQKDPKIKTEKERTIQNLSLMISKYQHFHELLQEHHGFIVGALKKIRQTNGNSSLIS